MGIEFIDADTAATSQEIALVAGHGPLRPSPCCTTRPGLGIGQSTVRIGGQRVSGLPCKKAAASGWGPWKGRRRRPDLGLRGWSPQMNSGVAGLVPSYCQPWPCIGVMVSGAPVLMRQPRLRRSSSCRRWAMDEMVDFAGSRSAADDLVRIVSHCQRTASGLMSCPRSR